MRTVYLLLALVLSLPLPLNAQDEHSAEKKGKTNGRHGHTHGAAGENRHREDDHNRKADTDGHDDHPDGKDDHAEEEDGHHEGESHEEGEGGEEEEFSSSVGPGNAVAAADAETGLQLSADAVRTLGIKTMPFPAGGLIGKEAVVSFKDETGVYRLRDGWYKLIEGKATPVGTQIRFTPNQRNDFRANDQIVVGGVALLRVAELDAFSGGEAGHGH